jgi:hypothetical protein
MSRPEIERELLTDHTWCDVCEIADLGLEEPVEYSEDGHVFITGSCRKCGQSVTSEITEKMAT